MGWGLGAVGWGLGAAMGGLHHMLENGCTSFLLHSTILASASPYFRACCWPGEAEGRLQDTEFWQFPTIFGVLSKNHGGKDIVAPPAGPLLLLERVEEEELPAMEVVLRHCYTEELADSGGDASELSVATLIQILMLAHRCSNVMVNTSTEWEG